MADHPAAADRGRFERLRHGFARLHAYLHRHPVTGALTKIVVTLVGLTVLVAGLVMMVTPGPGIVAIILGLAILALEWAWAERWMHAMKARAQSAADRAREMDPRVRRRRLALTTLAVLLVVGGVAAYVYAYDWPRMAVDSWDWVQDLSDVVPELPGM